MRRACSDDDDGAGEEGREADDAGEGVETVGNAIYFYAPVTKKSVMKLIGALSDAESYLQRRKVRKGVGGEDEERILLFIHSDGGDAYAGLSAMDHVQNANVPVYTVADGMVASAATFILLGGARRFCLPHSSVLIHQLTTGFWGKYVDLLDEVKNSKALMRTVKKIYKERTGMGDERIESLLRKEVTMTCEKCIKVGFVEGKYGRG